MKLVNDSQNNDMVKRMHWPYLTYFALPQICEGQTKLFVFSMDYNLVVGYHQKLSVRFGGRWSGVCFCSSTFLEVNWGSLEGLYGIAKKSIHVV